MQYISILFFLLIIICIFLHFYNNNNNNNKLVNDFNKKIIKFTEINRPNTNIYKFKTFYDISIFPELNNINASSIINELNNYTKNNNKWIEWTETDLWKFNNTNNWQVIPLIAFGKISPKYSPHFPNTLSQLSTIKNLVSAGFSKLGANTTLKLHKGWADLSNNVLRCHLGLIVPFKKCKIFVIGASNDFMYQYENKWIIFDDSLYHSASNEHNTQERVILLIDIKRPNNIPKGISDVKNSEELNNFLEKI